MHSHLTAVTHAYLLGSSARALNPREVHAIQTGDGVLWLHLDYSDPAMARWE